MLKLSILDAKSLGSDVDLSKFDKFGEVDIFETTSPQEVAGRIEDKDIIITNKVLLNESNLQHASSLKLICITATGTNNVDLIYANKRGIAVTNVAGYSTDSVAQHTFAMLFYLVEQLKYFDNYVKSKEYVISPLFTHLGRSFWEIKGKTWGIIGLGAIGSSVAAIAKAFGAKVVYYSTSGKNINQSHERLELEELLKTSDVVSVHAPLNPQTKDLIGYQELMHMKNHAILLNLGRGGIVNEADLAKALDEDIIGGAALDVLVNEPILENNPLLYIKNKEKLLITPHIAWASIEARNRLINEVVLNIESYIDGKNRNRV